MINPIFALVLFATGPNGAGIVQPVATFVDGSECAVNGITQVKTAKNAGFKRVRYSCVSSIVVTDEGSATGVSGPAGPAGAPGPVGPRGPAGEGCKEHCKKAKPGKRCYD